MTTFFRMILVIPIAVIFGLLTSGTSKTVYDQAGHVVSSSSGGIGTGLFLATVLMIVFRKPPRHAQGAQSVAGHTPCLSPARKHP